jgi:hypothetical protein
MLTFLGPFAKLRKSDYYLRHVCLSACLSPWKKSAPTERISIKFDIGEFFENLSTELKFHLNVARITGTLHACRLNENFYVTFLRNFRL